MAEFQAPKPPTSPAEQAANEKKIQNQETITRLRSNVANGAASTLQGKGLIKGSEAKKLTVIISDTLKVLEHERAGQNVSRELAPLINQWNEALGAERAQKALSALRESVGIYTQTTNQIMSNPAIVNIQSGWSRQGKNWEG